MTLALAAPPCPDSRLRTMDARWKLAGISGAIVGVSCLQTLEASGAALVLALALAWLARLPLRWMLARLGALLLFLAPFVLTMPLLTPGDDWQGGITWALILSAKAVALLTLALVLFVSSPTAETLAAAHALWVPGWFVRIVALTYRYAFVLASELRRMRVAMRARGYRNRPTAHCYRTLGNLTGMVLVRGHERGERVAQAMRCRGFDGRYRALVAFRTHAGDVLKFSLVLGLTAGLVAWDFWIRRAA